MPPVVLSVSLSPTHSFSKAATSAIRLLTGLGVEGDAHAGALVRHRYRVRKDPTAANLCQVHLLQAELFAELAQKGIVVEAGQMGENITSSGIDLLGLPRGTRLHLGASAVVEVTGLREPCTLMNKLRPGLMQACLERNARQGLIRKAGIMSVVVCAGLVLPGDAIGVELPPGPPEPLFPV